MTQTIEAIKGILPGDETKTSQLDFTMAAYLALVASLSRPNTGQSQQSEGHERSANLSKWVR